MKKSIRFIIVMSLSFMSLFAQVQITNTSVFYTQEQMLLANEINESGEPFAEFLGYNLDDLDPMVLNAPDSISYTFGIENYEYSRYQLGTIISRSGMGLHMMWAPVIKDMAAMETDPDFDGSFTAAPNGYKEDDELMKNIMHFSMLSNHAAPGNPWPQFAEFISGDPHLPQPIDPVNFSWNDFSTLRWDRTKMDKTLNLAAMGQSMMKQYLWAQDMLSAYHDGNDVGIDPAPGVSPDSADNPHFDPNNNIYFGGDALDGFVGQVLTAEAINKVKFTVTTLAYDGNNLGMVDPATYDPANGILYFPHKVSVTESAVAEGLPPMASEFSVTDEQSDLWDQVSFLWGTLNFTNMMNPDNSSSPAHEAYHHVFDGDPFPAPMSQTGMPGPFDLMKGTSKVIFLNVMNMHYNPSSGTLVDRSGLNAGIPELGNVISTTNAGYAILILQKFSEEFAGTPLESSALELLTAQADFLLDSLSNGSGRFYNSFTLGSGADQSSTQVAAQAGAIRGLYAAYGATGNTAYLEAANTAYDYLMAHFYAPAFHAFKTTESSETAVYTPFNFAVIAGALREARIVGEQADAPVIYMRFFKAVANKMQLSEGANSGETGSDSDGDGIPFIPEQPDNLPPVFASEATLDLTVTGIEDDNFEPNRFELSQNYPNPFNPSTRIKFNITSRGFYQLNVYNVLGEKVANLINGPLAAQSYEVEFNAGHLASGIYYYELQGNGLRQVKKMTLIK